MRGPPLRLSEPIALHRRVSAAASLRSRDEGTPALFRGEGYGAALLQNTSCVLPFRPAKKQLFNFAPGKISLVTLLLL